MAYISFLCQHTGHEDIVNTEYTFVTWFKHLEWDENKKADSKLTCNSGSGSFLRLLPSSGTGRLQVNTESLKSWAQNSN